MNPLPSWLHEPLAQALATQRAHALLVHGPEGIGQFELGLALARAWLCETAPVERPRGFGCGRCGACHLIDGMAHPDLRVIVPEALRGTLGLVGDEEAEPDEDGKKRKPSREIKVEQIRAALDFSELTAGRARLKVVLLYPAERMNAIAANALLKTLEEPPGVMRFVLACGDADALLPTIRSRCQALRLELPAPAEAEAWLAAAGVVEPAVALAAAGGQPQWALERARLGVEAALWRRLPELVARNQAAALTDWPLPLVIDALQKLCHDQARVALGQAPRYFEAPGAVDRAALDALTAWAAELRTIARHAQHPLNAGLAVETLVQGAHRAGRGIRRPPRVHSPTR